MPLLLARAARTQRRAQEPSLEAVSDDPAISRLLTVPLAGDGLVTFTVPPRRSLERTSVVAPFLGAVESQDTHMSLVPARPGVDLGEGTLWVGGALRNSNVAITSDGTLGGGGRVDGNVDNQGTMALDAGDGFIIGGNYVQGADARLSVTLGHGALQVQGNASLDGTVHVAGARQGYVTRDREEILRVAGTRTGFFDGLTYDANRVFFQGSVSYDFQSAWLDISRLDVLAAIAADEAGFKAVADKVRAALA